VRLLGEDLVTRIPTDASEATMTVAARTDPEPVEDDYRDAWWQVLPDPADREWWAVADEWSASHRSSSWSLDPWFVRRTYSDRVAAWWRSLSDRTQEDYFQDVEWDWLDEWVPRFVDEDGGYVEDGTPGAYERDGVTVDRGDRAGFAHATATYRNDAGETISVDFWEAEAKGLWTPLPVARRPVAETRPVLATVASSTPTPKARARAPRRRSSSKARSPGGSDDGGEPPPPPADPFPPHIVAGVRPYARAWRRRRRIEEERLAGLDPGRDDGTAVPDSPVDFSVSPATTHPREVSRGS
jgi:hypothetical protein